MAEEQERMADERPIAFNPTGRYNLGFVDWRNELERIMEEDTYEQHVRPTHQMDLDRRLNPQDYPSDEEEQAPQQQTDQIVVGPLDKKHLKLLTVMKMGKSSKSCAVCLLPFACDELILRLPCSHIFHRDCLQPWLAKQGRCPNCRLDLNSHFAALSAPQPPAPSKPISQNPYL